MVRSTRVLPFCGNLIAQGKGILHYLSEDEQIAIEAIALYPQKERTVVLEASVHPEILVRMESIKRNTESQYKAKLHFYHYLHFTIEVIGHYYGPRTGGASGQPVVRDWVETHRSELPEGWFNDDENRVMRIQEYGKFKMDYDQTLRASTEKTPTQREFLKENAEKYPTLKPVLNKKSPTSDMPQKKFREYEPLKEGVPEKYIPREKVIEQEKTPRPEAIDRAKQSHENAWDRLRSQPSPSQQKSPQQTAPSRTAPPPRTQPSPTQARRKN